MPTMTFERQTFVVSRALSFFSEPELTRQIGHPRAAWPLVLVKELIDNGLDACENADCAPQIDVIVTPDAFIVRDNGPGMPSATLRAACDFTVTVSDKALYASPSRGQQGNALKTVIAAPFAASGGERGRIVIETGGIAHTVTARANRIAGTPEIAVTSAPSAVKSGTSVQVCWPDSPSYLDHRQMPDSYRAATRRIGDVRILLRDLATVNPHATFTLTLADGDEQGWPATDPGWKKWRPNDATSPHWYTVERMRDLVAAKVRDQQGAVLVRDFLAEFRGLKSTVARKQLLDPAGFTGLRLRDLTRDGDIDRPKVATLLTAMQVAARVVQPADLGVLGKEHLTDILEIEHGATPTTIQYRKARVMDGGVPVVLEAAFGLRDDDNLIDITVGLNFTTTFTNPLGDTLEDLLAVARVQYNDPVSLIIHLATPTPAYLDPGKTRLTLSPAIRDALTAMIPPLTKQWTGYKGQVERDASSRDRARQRLLRDQRRDDETLKDAVYAVLPAAYAHASDDGQLPVNARQLFYATRPLVQQRTGKTLIDTYFTQTLLPEYHREYPDLTAGWDVLYDARGHFTAPFGGGAELGTADVRAYIRSWTSELPNEHPAVTIPYAVETHEPTHQFGGVLFIEKEGFDDLIERSGLARRYDLALMSTKGMSNVAARTLIHNLSERGVPIFVAHDFDRSGFIIARTLREDTRRYEFPTPPKVIDLGLRLADAQAMGLASEGQSYSGKGDPRGELRRCGATAEECNFLVRGKSGGGWAGERIELNAMTSPQFIAWLEHHLEAQGVKKVVPGDAVLAHHYRTLVRTQRLVEAFAVMQAHLCADDPPIAIPPNLAAQVQAALDANPEHSWGNALIDVVLCPKER